ncbi:MAG: hypothetical protein J5851_00840 [Oscillospiraceae bacterium]|nr:hypothetical protein [Oscillospiraceae bacterium]
MWKKAAAILVMMGMLMAGTGCSTLTTVNQPDSVPAKPAQANQNGWHCEELFHTKNEEPLRIPEEQEEADRETLNVYYNMPMELTEDWTIKGWFDQDVSIAIGNTSDCSDSARGKTSYESAEYGDTWYFNINDPENYVHGLPERLMPDFIRISYMPRGSIIVNERECILINFCYYNEAGDAITDAMGFTCFNGPDTTDGWNWGIDISESE